VDKEALKSLTRADIMAKINPDPSTSRLPATGRFGNSWLSEDKFRIRKPIFFQRSK
jgi:hypothetical protein